MNKSEANTPNPTNTDAYKKTLNAITKIHPELINIFTTQNIVDCLRDQQFLDLNDQPFMFSEEEEHVWQVLEALEAVFKNNNSLFSKDKEGEELNENTFNKFVSLANDFKKDERLVIQIWIVVFLHDIAKFSVQNADHARISGYLVRGLFKTNDFGLTEHEQERIVWVISNHDVVGNIVSSAERAPRYLTERLEKLSGEEKQIRLNMLILLSLCDLRGTLNGRFVNDDNAISRFWAADLSWLKNKEENLFNWRKERLVRASIKKVTGEKQKDWDTAFEILPGRTQQITKNQFGNNFKVITNLLYLALHLSGEELVKLFALISLLVEKVADGKPNPNYQVDFTQGAERDKPGPIVNMFKTALEKINLCNLDLDMINEIYNAHKIYGIPFSVSQNNLTIDSIPRK